MNGRWGTVAVIGVGLLGASIGLGLKARGFAGAVRGLGRRQSSLDRALEVGAIDSAHLQADEAVADADLVVVCTPVVEVCRKLREIAPLVKQGCVVTDVASTKKDVCAEGRRLFGVPCHFIGSHPMAGSEKFGAEHGTPDFYEGSVALMEPLGAELDADAHAGVRGLWEHLGARVVEIDPAAHDASLARTSHVPHVAAAAIALAADALGDVDNLAGGGFRDTTRIADGRPEVWRDICLTNASAVDEGLDALVEEIQAFRACLKEGDADLLESFFERARLARRRIVQQ